MLAHQSHTSHPQEGREQPFLQNCLLTAVLLVVTRVFLPMSDKHALPCTVFPSPDPHEACSLGGFFFLSPFSIGLLGQLSEYLPPSPTVLLCFLLWLKISIHGSNSSPSPLDETREASNPRRVWETEGSQLEKLLVLPQGQNLYRTKKLGHS